jgi:hypothetical protein
VDSGPQDYPTLYAVVTVTLLTIVVLVQKGVADVLDVARCPACGRLRRRSRPCPCATRRTPLR